MHLGEVLVGLFCVTDTSHIDYMSIRTSPNAHFHSASRGYSFAIIDEGKKYWPKIAQEILANSRSQRLPSDRFSTVFVRQRDIDNLREAIGAYNTSMPNGKSMTSKYSSRRLATVLGAAKSLQWRLRPRS